jgi:hypothetical protein
MSARLKAGERQGAHTARRGPWVVLALVILFTVGAEGLGLVSGEGVDGVWLAMLIFPVVGALIASRQPGNAIGWILLGVGIGGGLGMALGIYAYLGLEVQPPLVPAPAVALALESPLWIPFIGLSAMFPILLFPDGRLPSPGWRPWAYFCAGSIAVAYALFLVSPDLLQASEYPRLDNPFAVHALGPFIQAAFPFIILSLPVAMVGCAVALVRRFRRSRGRVRMQLKWLAAAGAMVAATYLLLMLLNLEFGNPDPTWLRVASSIGITSFALIPIAIGVAILRYRLYDIDLIINRTLVYTALTATLTAAYFLLVTLLQSVLRPIAGTSQLAVAGSTLIVAAIFRPLRARIQAFVDRRFYRSKFDAQTTLERFAAQLRDEVDLPTLSRHLVEVVNGTIKPVSTSLWLRPPAVASTEVTIERRPR